MNAEIKVVILTEAGENLGFGHIIRSISLFDAFKKKQIYSILIINGDKTINKIIGNRKCYIYDWLKEKDKLYKELQGSDIIIIDSYLADLHIYEKISELVKLPVYIDDNLRLNYPPGILINVSLGPEDIAKNNNLNLIYLSGLEYCMLNREYWEVDNKDINENINTIILTFGSCDERNLTPKILTALDINFPYLRKNVIIGQNYNNITEIEKIRNENCELIYFPSPKEMKAVMMESDIAITAGGQTIFESARVGVPTIAIVDAENQIKNVRKLDELGIILYAGEWRDNSLVENIIKLIKKLADISLRKELILKSRKYIKPNGSQRIVDFLIKRLIELNPEKSAG